MTNSLIFFGGVGEPPDQVDAYHPAKKPSTTGSRQPVKSFGSPAFLGSTVARWSHVWSADAMGFWLVGNGGIY